MSKRKSEGKPFYDALNSLDFRNDLSQMFGFPSFEIVSSDDGIDNFVQQLEENVKEKNFSLVRLKHEKQLAEMLLKRSDARYEKLQSKATTLLGFSAAIFTFILGVLVPFHDRIGATKISFLIELFAIILIGAVIIALIKISRPKPGYELKKIYVGNDQDEKVNVNQTNEEISLYNKEIANYWMAIGIRNYSNDLVGHSIIKRTKEIACALLLLFLDLIVKNIDFVQNVFVCFYCNLSQ
jgi:hypothetical protein